MITSNRKLLVLNYPKEVFTTLVDNFDTDEWRAESERGKNPVRFMKFIYAELDVGSTASSLVGNNICLVRPVIRE